MVFRRRPMFRKRFNPYNPVRKAVAKVKRTKLRKFVDRRIKRMDPIKYTYNEIPIINPLSSDVPVPFINWPYQGTSEYVNIQALGSGGITRVGNSINIRSLEFKYTLQYGSNIASGNYTNFNRLIFFQWMDNTGTVNPGVGDILMNTPALSSGSFQPWMAHFNPYTRGKYKILYDKVHKTSPVGGTSSMVGPIKLNLASKLRKHKIQINNDGRGGLGCPVYSGNIYAFFLSDGSVEGPELQYTYRLGFSDN